MKLSSSSFGITGVLVLVFAGLFAVARPVLAQQDASTSDAVVATDGSAEQSVPTTTVLTDDAAGTVLGVSTSSDESLGQSTTDDTVSAPAASDATTAPTDTGSAPATVDTGAAPSDNAPTSDANTTVSEMGSAAAEAATDSGTTTTESAANIPETPPVGLAEVHIIGMKYIDYFTDGTSTFSFPGDPQIDENFDKPNAPIPTHEGLTWVHSTGQYLYDTPSGDLEEGEYAVLANGHYISRGVPFISSTSTPDTIATSSAASDEFGNSTEGSSSTTTSSDSAPESSTTTAPTGNSTPITVPDPVDTTIPSSTPDGTPPPPPPDNSTTSDQSIIDSSTADTPATTTSADPATAPVTNDSAADSGQTPAAATTTDTPSIQ
jgi:hypothetical protein